MAKTLTIVLWASPYSGQHVAKAIGLAETALDRGHRVHLYATGERVYAFTRGQGALHLPLARGRISFVRRVGRTGTIELPGGSGRVGRRLPGQYVVATLYTHRREIVVKLEGRVVKRFPCPMRETLVPPLYPLPRGRS